MDFYHDHLGKTLKKVASALPENVTKADLTDVEALPDSSFAWPEKRAFPVHRPEDILLSTAYYCNAVLRDGEQIPGHVKTNLVKAAYVWKIEDQFQKVASAIAKEAAPEPVQEYWGLVENYKGQPIKRYPLFDGQHVKMASDHFSKNYSHYPFTWRVKIATRIEKRANELGVKIPTNSVVNVYTRKSAVDLEKAATFIGVRIPFLSKLGMKDEAMALTKTAKVLSRGTTEPFNADVLVNTIMKVDKIARLDNRYDKEFPDPFMSVYNELEKTAQDESVINIMGDQYKMSELAALKPSVYENALGTDFVTNITDDDQKTVNMDKLATILPTLPRDEKSTLNMHLKKHIKDAEAVAEPNIAAGA